MTKTDFTKRLRSLFNIEGAQLPELTVQERSWFIEDPVDFFLNASGSIDGADKADAIWREVEKRQRKHAENVG